jgi:hypothetical protein
VRRVTHTPPGAVDSTELTGVVRLTRDRKRC